MPRSFDPISPEQIEAARTQQFSLASGMCATKMLHNHSLVNSAEKILNYGYFPNTHQFRRAHTLSLSARYQRHDIAPE
ncbi:MAG: hypothetical protein WAW10_06840 [Gallionella sp.]